ncbi:MAG: hypothetical protein IKQ35_04075 [Bacilli bacterium]|nr:hypothetical protein [Bacilli bacterium]
MKLQVGEVITLSNNEEYVCVAFTNYKGSEYVYLITASKPVKVQFAKVTYQDQVHLTTVSDPTEKQELLKLFTGKMQ